MKICNFQGDGYVLRLKNYCSFNDLTLGVVDGSVGTDDEELAVTEEFLIYDFRFQICWVDAGGGFFGPVGGIGFVAGRVRF